MVSLVEAARAPGYPAEIALVLSNVPGAPGLARASGFGIATATVDHRAFARDREAFERAMDEVLRLHQIDLVVLAGFMRIMTPWFVQRWAGRSTGSIRRRSPRSPPAMSRWSTARSSGAEPARADPPPRCSALPPPSASAGRDRPGGRDNAPRAPRDR
ncbi:MAG: hypothetical protein B7Z40_21640 [Bosea sp. 12-68-7]|nr:MAG: hypothetical protein B7Z40_21640 [Bosea sp. 12-68-7]